MVVMEFGLKRKLQDIAETMFLVEMTEYDNYMTDRNSRDTIIT